MIFTLKVNAVKNQVRNLLSAKKIIFIFSGKHNGFYSIYNQKRVKNMSEKIKWIICLISGFIVDILGGWDIWLTALLTVMVIDILTGILKAVLMRSNKSESGGLSSESMFRGGAKKIFILLMVTLGAVLDSIISPDNGCQLLYC